MFCDVLCLSFAVLVVSVMRIVVFFFLKLALVVTMTCCFVSLFARNPSFWKPEWIHHHVNGSPSLQGECEKAYALLVPLVWERLKRSTTRFVSMLL